MKKYGRLFTLFTEEFGYWPSANTCHALPYNEAKKMCSLLYKKAKEMERNETVDRLWDFTRTKDGEIQKLLYETLSWWY